MEESSGEYAGLNATVTSIIEDGEKVTVIELQNTTMWKLNGKLHRGGNKPAYRGVLNEDRIDERYSIHGVPHRSNGTVMGEQEAGCALYSLFGQMLPESLFNMVVKHSRDNSCPLLLSWLWGYQLISDEQIESFKDEQGNWLQLPAEWIWKAANVDVNTMFNVIWEANNQSIMEETRFGLTHEEIFTKYASFIKQHQYGDPVGEILKVASFLQKTNPIA